MTTTDSDSAATTAGGFLSDLGLDKVEADPNFLPDGKYHGFLYEAKVVNFKDTAKGKSLVFTYKVDGDVPGQEPHKGKTIDEWKSCNAFDDERKKAWLKQRILSLGVPESKINSLNLDDLKGIAVTFSVKQNGDYRNVNSVVLRDGSAASASTTDSVDGGPTPSATTTAGVEDLL